MPNKLKSVFRRSSKSRSFSGQHESDTQPAKASPPRGDRHPLSSNRHDRASVDSSATGTIHTSRSRPVSSIYDDFQTRTTLPDGVLSPSDPNGGAIANDYKAYLPALSPVNDDVGDDYVTSNASRNGIAGRGEVRHEENVADRNIARYSSSFDAHRNTTATKSLPGQPHSHKEAAIEGNGLALSPTRHNGSAEKHSTGHDIVNKGGMHGGLGLRPKTRDADLQNRSIFPPGRVRAEGIVDRKPLVPPKDPVSDINHTTADGTANGEETALAKRLRGDGVVDLRNTVDTDGDITWAPAVTHEVIKPHQHEIVQQKIYREIHNYEHFHRIQPVMMTEVLPPRHWIPNPNGEGLIEISAEELPARTGDNRWWSICEHSTPQPPQTSLPKYRTKPEIIDAGTYVTAEGFERKETSIIHPPTLADLTGYGGPVQTMHFDHKTGKSWLGELTTMDQLEKLQKELDRAPDAQSFNMDGLAESLSNVHPDSARRASIPRKPVHAQS